MVPSAETSNCAVAENVPLMVTVAVAAEDGNASATQLLTPQVVPEPVILPLIEALLLPCAKAAIESRKTAKSCFIYFPRMRLALASILALLDADSLPRFTI